MGRRGLLGGVAKTEKAGPVGEEAGHVWRLGQGREGGSKAEEAGPSYRRRVQGGEDGSKVVLQAGV